MLWVLVPIFLAVVWLFMIFPGKSNASQRAPFEKRMFAHRGLHNAQQHVPENSLAAFRLAREAGYGVELDVQRTKDGHLVILHDPSLERACGKPGRVSDYTLAELSAFRLFGTDERIPLLSDALDTLGSETPVIVELKPGRDWTALCEGVRNMLACHPGIYCIESFDPRLVQWFRKNAPDVLRGQLSEAYRYSSKNLPWYLALAMSRMLSNVIARPQFSAYRVGSKCLSVRLVERLGAMRVVWTVRTAEEASQLRPATDCIIFEGFRPDTRF